MLRGAPVSVFLATSNAKASAAFYSDVMGLKQTDDSPFALVFDLHGAELRISKVPSFKPQPWTVLDWHVRNIEAAMNGLAQKGVTFERFEGMDQDEAGIWRTPDGVQIAWFKDPDGNVLSVSQRN